MPVVSLTDRTPIAAGNRLVRFVFQRHLETALYGCLRRLEQHYLEGNEACRMLMRDGIGSTTRVAIKRWRSRPGTITQASSRSNRK